MILKASKYIPCLYIKNRKYKRAIYHSASSLIAPFEADEMNGIVFDFSWLVSLTRFHFIVVISQRKSQPTWSIAL